MLIPVGCSMTATWLALDTIRVAQVGDMRMETLQLFLDLLVRNPHLETEPVVCYQAGDGTYMLEGGRHRMFAHVMAGRQRIAAVIVPHPQAKES